MGMGFPEIRCKRALMKTGHSGADAAMTWLFEHMDDIDLDDPIVENDASDVDLTPFIDMGFTEAQAKKALKETVYYCFYVRITKCLELLIGYSVTPILRNPKSAKRRRLTNLQLITNYSLSFHIVEPPLTADTM